MNPYFASQPTQASGYDVVGGATPTLKKLSSVMRRCVTVLGIFATLAIPTVRGNAQEKITAPGRDIQVKTKNYKFEYIYPAAAGRIPELKAILEKNAASEQADIAKEAREARAENKGRDAFIVPLERYVSWQVVTELPEWLSLTGTGEEYSGGAHPNHGPTALLWNKVQKQEVKVADLFVSKAALSQAIRTPFCKALNQQRAKRRGSPVDPKSTDEFDACLDPAEEVVIVGSTDHEHFTRIGILMGPYEAGPYAEGDYEITLPVTQAVLSAVRPEYRAAFALER